MCPLPHRSFLERDPRRSRLLRGHLPPLSSCPGDCCTCRAAKIKPAAPEWGPPAWCRLWRRSASVNDALCAVIPPERGDIRPMIAETESRLHCHRGPPFRRVHAAVSPYAGIRNGSYPVASPAYHPKPGSQPVRKNRITSLRVRFGGTRRGRTAPRRYHRARGLFEDTPVSARAGPRHRRRGSDPGRGRD